MLSGNQWRPVNNRSSCHSWACWLATSGAKEKKVAAVSAGRANRLPVAPGKQQQLSQLGVINTVLPVAPGNPIAAVIAGCANRLPVAPGKSVAAVTAGWARGLLVAPCTCKLQQGITRILNLLKEQCLEIFVGETQFGPNSSLSLPQQFSFSRRYSIAMSIHFSFPRSLTFDNSLKVSFVWFSV